MRVADYEIIAEIIHSLPHAFGLRNTVAKHFAGRLAENYPRFNVTTFLEACGVTNQDDDE